MSSLQESNDYFYYLIKESFFGKIYRSFILYPFLRSITGRCFLDVGCGIGRMLSTGCVSCCCGLDVNKNAIEYCKSLGKKAFLIPESGFFPLDSHSYSVAICDQVIEHLSCPKLLLSELYRVLKPGGRLIVGVPCMKGYLSDSDHKHYYTRSMLLEVITSAGFSKSFSFYFPFPFPVFGRFFSFQYLYVVLHKS